MKIQNKAKNYKVEKFELKLQKSNKLIEKTKNDN